MSNILFTKSDRKLVLEKFFGGFQIYIECKGYFILKFGKVPKHMPQYGILVDSSVNGLSANFLSIYATGALLLAWCFVSCTR